MARLRMVKRMEKDDFTTPNEMRSTKVSLRTISAKAKALSTREMVKFAREISVKISWKAPLSS